MASVERRRRVTSAKEVQRRVPSADIQAASPIQLGEVSDRPIHSPSSFVNDGAVAMVASPVSSSEDEEKEVLESRREMGSMWTVGVAAGDRDGKEERGRGIFNMGCGAREGVVAGDGDGKEERGRGIVNLAVG
ncbi:hypothetical protein COCNU_14G006990 [Cocos nucifera]|uniref:Uncharacterized protein n=1 Tax=Cocos nucifera TaxID=13894 RepID=A0A8K0NBW1_COCNU|nr:hypothetical protein COCNU_14G006990 [Cocos nucifera]